MKMNITNCDAGSNLTCQIVTALGEVGEYIKVIQVKHGRSQSAIMTCQIVTALGEVGEYIKVIQVKHGRS